MQRVKLALVCLSWLCLVGAVSAQSSTDPVASPAGSATVQSSGGNAVVSGAGIFDGTYLDVRHVIGDGVGYVNSYSQVGAFLPVWMTEDFLIAPNSRLIVTNSTQTGVNAGLVGRQYLSSLDRLIGVYGYYDNDQDQYNYRYDQVTVGAETLGRWWDLRANGYFLNGSQNNFLQAQSVGGNPFYSGNNIVFTGSQLRTQALGGADIEFGIPLTPSTPWLRVYSGAYGYHSNEQGTAIGYRGRLEANIANDLMLGMTVSTDPLYGTNLNGIIEFKFSGFKPTTYFPNLTTRQRMLSTVQRNWRVATHTYIQDVNVVAYNPNSPTNQPYFVTFVNNAAAPGGNGTFEHPYTSLPSTAPGNIILVENGNSSPTNPVHGSITLANNQVLVGTGFPYPITLAAQYGSSSINGLYTLPLTSSSNPYPVIGGTSGNVVTLANNNEVTGLTIMGAGGSAITNTASGSSNFYLHDLNIIGNSGYGISLTNASSNTTSTNYISQLNGTLVTGAIINNINTGNGGLSNPAGLGGNTLGGIQISSGGAGLNLQLSNTNMNGTSASPEAFGVSLMANNAPLTVSMNNITTNGNGTGIILDENDQTLTASMNINSDGSLNNSTSVTASNNTGAGIQVEGTGGTINIDANNVTANANGSDNLQIGSSFVPIAGANVNVAVNNSNFNGSLGGSGVMFSESGNGSSIPNILTLTNVNSSGNYNYGLGLFGSSGTQMSATVTNTNTPTYGNFTGNFDAFHVDGSSGAALALTVDPTNASNSGNDGLYFKLAGASSLNATFTNDNLDSSGQLVPSGSAVSLGNAVHGELSNLSLANVTFTGTTGRGSAGDGFYLNSLSQSSSTFTINNGSFSNSGVKTPGSSAYDVNADNSSVTLTTNSTPGNNFDQNNNVGTQSFGLKLNASDSAQFTGTFTNGDFSNTLANAVNFNVSTDADASITLAGTSGNNSGADGIYGNVSGGLSVANLTIQSTTVNGNTVNSTFNNNGANGLNFAVASGTLNVNATNSSFNNNGAGGAGGSGVLGLVQSNGVANVTFTNTTINNNLDNGVYVTTNGGGNVNATFSGGSVNNNGNALITPRFNDGILLNLSGSTNSSLNISSSTSVSSNGNDGIAILATNGTNFTGNWTGLSILNNGTAANPGALPYTGAGLDVQTDNSVVNLTLNSVTSGNTGTSTSQKIGYLAVTTDSGVLTTTVTGSNLIDNTTGFQADTNTSGQLTATFNTSNLTNNSTGFLSDTETGGVMTTTFAGGSLSNNSTNAVNALVAGAGSVASINLNGITANGSGGDGAFFDVTTNGILNVTSTASTSISSSGGNGILVAVDGTGSQANFSLTSTTLTNNGTGFGGMGFDGIVTNGGNLNAEIASSTITANANQGIGLSVDGATSTAYFDVRSATAINSNRSEGLSISATDGASVYYRSIGNSYSNNGSNGSLAGVNLTADTGATLLTLFSGDTISGNTGDGITLNATNGAIMTTSLNNDIITNNGGYGIDAASVSGATTSFNLIMTGSGTSTSGNTKGSFSAFNFSNMNQVVLQLAGSFNGNTTGSGVSIKMTDIQNLAVSLQGNGTGTIDNNTGGDGITVNVNDTAIAASDPSASLLIQGFSDISNNGNDGINATFTDVFNAAVQISGASSTTNTTYTKNGKNAVELNLVSSNLVNNFSLGGITTIEELTTTNNLTPFSPPNLQLTTLPTPVPVSISSVAPTTALTISGVTATGSGANGIIVTATNTNIDSNGAFITGNSISGSKNGDGIAVNLTSSTADGLSISGNGSQSNTGNGISVSLTNTPINNLTISNNNLASGSATVGAGISNNGLDGIRLGLNNSTLNSLLMSGNTITGNGTTATGHGIEFTDVPGGTGVVQNSDITDATLTNNTITGNSGDGVRLVNPTTPTSQISMTLTGNTISSNTGLGVNLNLVSGQQDLVTNFTGNTISSNKGGAGVEIQLADNHSLLSSNIDGSISSGFTNNTISGNAAQGVDFLMGLNGNITANFAGNTINSNTLQGVNFIMGQNGTLTSDFTGTAANPQSISNNGQEGVNISLSDGGSFFSNNFYGNTISSNGSFGVIVSSPPTATDAIFWNLGDSTQMANTINGNTNAGVAINLYQASTGTLNIANTTISNTKLGSNTNYAGEGLNISQSGSSILTGSITSSSFTGNAGDGALFSVTGNNLGIFAQLNNFTVGGGTAALGNKFTGNGSSTNALSENDGLEFLRTADGEINNVTISNNTIDSNLFGNGLAIHARSAATQDSYTINNNDISHNGANGVLYDEQADAKISSNMNLNTIESNGANGIQLTERSGNVDTRYLTGTWTQNTVTFNHGNGIALDGRTVGLTIGDVTLATTQNISNNVLSGIEVSGSGSATIVNNMIESNGTAANVGTDNQNGGIVALVAPTSNLTIENNTIFKNAGDGVQYSIRQGFDGYSSKVTITDNTIVLNSFRGVDIINRGNNSTQADVSGNTISANTLEGIYVINTASTDQSQVVSSNFTGTFDGVTYSNGVASDGAPTNNPHLEFRAVGNDITGNGLGNGVLTGTGLVVRVGTSDGITGAYDAANDTGGFASTGFSLAAGDGTHSSTDASANTFFAAASAASSRGGVIAQIDYNTFGGNFSRDVLFSSFVSTTPIPTAAGTWGVVPTPPTVPTTYAQTITSYTSDPLSRFDLFFRYNTNGAGGNAQIDSFGTSLSGTSGAFSRTPSLVAFYNDADGVFKSRLNSITPATNAGPFISATRARNATRDAAVGASPSDGSNGNNVDNLKVLYPGTGPSAWRLSSDSNNGINQGGFNFIDATSDETPYPYAWGVIP